MLLMSQQSTQALMDMAAPVKVWSVVVIYAGIIFGFSSLPSVCMPPLFPGADHIYHFIEFLPFGFFVIRALHISGLKDVPHLVGAALLLVVVYALSDEIHQLFVPGRQFSFLDVASDVAGAVVGKALYLKWQR